MTTKVQGLLLGRLPYAFLLAVTLILGTAIGGAGFEAVNPSFDRITWLEHAGASPTGDVAVRRALFSDGRYLALSADGYRAGVLDTSLTAELFATVRAGAKAWQSTYDMKGAAGDRIELRLEGRSPRGIAISNPGMNPSLPSDLSRVVRILSAADRPVATIEFKPTSLRFTAVAEDHSGGEPVEALPVGFPLQGASEPGGVVIGGGDLSILQSIWTDLDSLLEPAVAHRFANVDGKVWRISWSLDVDGMGAMPGVSTP